jgi:hypothetical protein
MFKIKVTGDKQIKDALRKAPGILETALQREIYNSAHSIGTIYRRKISKHTVTGDLRDSIVVDADKGGTVAEAGSTNVVAIFMELGTRPHPIRPRKRKCLKFFSERKGDFVFTKYVFSPGMKPRHLLLSAYDDVMTPIKKFTDRITEKLGAIK